MKFILNGFVPTLMGDLSCYGPRKFISEFEIEFWCTAGLLLWAIPFTIYASKLFDVINGSHFKLRITSDQRTRNMIPEPTYQTKVFLAILRRIVWLF